MPFSNFSLACVTNERETGITGHNLSTTAEYIAMVWALGMCCKKKTMIG